MYLSGIFARYSVPVTWIFSSDILLFGYDRGGSKVCSFRILWMRGVRARTEYSIIIMRMVSNDLTEPNDVWNDATKMLKLFAMAVTHYAYRRLKGPWPLIYLFKIHSMHKVKRILFSFLNACTNWRDSILMFNVQCSNQKMWENVMRIYLYLLLWMFFHSRSFFLHSFNKDMHVNK